MEQNPYLEMFPRTSNSEKVDNKPEEPNIFLKSINRENVKEDILEASQNLANYLEAEKVPNVMFLDGSARQAYIGLKEVWKKDHAGSPEPNIYFINPKAIIDEADFAYFEGEFWKKYKNLKPEEAILLYDVCIHNGTTIIKIKDFFKYLGFQDIRLAITSVNDDFSEDKKAELDLICLPNHAKLGCHPFGKPTYIKNSGHLTVKPSEAGREIGKMEHEKIKEVFKD